MFRIVAHLKERNGKGLTCVEFADGGLADTVRLALDAADIESRPLWKPMHAQPAFTRQWSITTGVSDRLFERGLCLPSSSKLTDAEIDRVIDVIRRTLTR